MLVFKISRGARVFNCPTSFRDSIAPTRATTVKYVYYWYYTGIPGIFYCHSERHRTTVWRLSAIASPSLLPISNTKRLFLYLYYQQRKVLAQLKNNHCEHQRCALLFCSRCGVVLWCCAVGVCNECAPNQLSSQQQNPKKPKIAGKNGHTKKTIFELVGIVEDIALKLAGTAPTPCACAICSGSIRRVDGSTRQT